jgi:superfamily II RNA helicase
VQKGPAPNLAISCELTTLSSVKINSANELVLTELILDNVFADYEPAEVVALLSGFVFQEKSESEPLLTPKLEEVRGIVCGAGKDTPERC